MEKERLAAFSDGVLAIIITIMVLELKAPHGGEPGDLVKLIPGFLSYVLSFIYIAIYWNNHHHMLAAVRRVNGSVLWANMHLLFWLSLIPFTTAWLGENHFSRWPTALYGVVLLGAAIAYVILQTTIMRAQGPDSLLAHAIGGDRKGKLSLALYAAAVGLAFVTPLASSLIFVLVALIWLAPDRRIERLLARSEK
ncbi:MAG: TMEM175 family protein [Rhodoblastus sp.]